jgi:hypothetical protein
MQRWKEGLIAAAVVALCVYGIVAQFSGDAPPEIEARRIEAIAVGDRLLADITLRDVSDPPLLRNVLGSYGRTATVLYSWSAACPCILDLEPRLRALAARFGKQQGVAWIALAGEPEEGLVELRAKRDAMQAFYPVLRDPEQEICRRLGLLHAGQVAVLDRDGRLVYRGAVDDHWRTGKAEHLEAALVAVTSGKPPAVAEVPRRYGCAFSVPLSCLADAAPETE